MEGTEKKTPFKALVEKGKATGKLTTQDIDAAMIEMNLDVEELDKLYETLEANNIEVVDDISSDAIENFDVDIPKSLDIGAGDDKGANVDDPQGLSQGDRQGAAAHPRGGDRACYQNSR